MLGSGGGELFCYLTNVYVYHSCFNFIFPFIHTGNVLLFWHHQSPIIRMYNCLLPSKILHSNTLLWTRLNFSGLFEIQQYIVEFSPCLACYEHCFPNRKLLVIQLIQNRKKKEENFSNQSSLSFLRVNSLVGWELTCCAHLLFVSITSLVSYSHTHIYTQKRNAHPQTQIHKRKV